MEAVEGFFVFAGSRALRRYVRTLEQMYIYARAGRFIAGVENVIDFRQGCI
jgi:hypothetical protein